MEQYDYDLFVIGAGSGGVRASRMSAQFGARVAVCDDAPLGGTCVNVGCVPKKLFVYSSQFAADVEDSAGFGWSVVPPAFDWKTLISNKNKEIERLNGIYGRIMENVGVQIIRGRGRIVGPHAVEVAGKRYTSKAILVATGTWPFVPPIPGHELAITSNEAFFLEDLPKRVVMVGGGYIGVEFASIFRGFGSEVTLVHRNSPALNNSFDVDVRETLTEEMTRRGVTFRFGTQVAKIVRNEDGSLTSTLSDDSVVVSDCVMFATGRVPRTKDIGLEEVGVEVNARNYVIVNNRFQTSVPSIYALGDIIGGMTLTPVALAEGMILAKNLFNGASLEMDYTNIATAVFSQPNVGTVGLTEREAKERYGDVEIFRSTFRPMKNTISGRGERTMMKLIVERAENRVVGCHMVGPDAGEIIQGIAVALKCGATKAQFDATIGIHPTAAEEFVTMRTPLN